MKTPSDEQLAEFVAELIKLEPTPLPGMWWHEFCWKVGSEKEEAEKFGIGPDTMFEGRFVPPIIRHLIEEEMGIRKWNINYRTDSSDIHFYDIWKYEIYGKGEDVNKTRAVALAACRALGGKAK